MKESLFFSVYEHTFVLKDNLLISRKFIVLKDSSKHIVKWTDFHKYIKSNSTKPAKKITDDSNQRFYYVVKLLNFAFFEKYNIKRLTDITIDIVKDFLNAYGMGTLPDDVQVRSESTVNLCIKVIIDFLICLHDENKKTCCFKKTDLFKTIEVRNKYGKIVKKSIPTFEVNYISEPKTIFRDMPEKAFFILLDVVVRKHTSILMLVALSAFAGLRPSESCNVRRLDSKLGPGIRFVVIDGEVVDIIIDLKRELNLRSDLQKVGLIKKEREQRVYPLFLKAFYECYQIYMDYMENRTYEAEYGALSVNKQGRAMTYNSFYGKFKKAVQDTIPLLLASNDPEVVNYGHLLQENSLGPHILRHWFSVRLTLLGEDVSGLMYWRGDRSPESALTYLQNKSDLERQFTKVNNEMFDYHMWYSKKLFGGENYD